MAKCPTCKKETPPKSEYRPFCTSRCKDIDLSHWLSEGYRLSRPMEIDEIEDVIRALPPVEGEYGPN